MGSSFPARTALVLGGGGLKGFAHIGVLRALRERGIVPSLYAGTSIGSLIAAAHLSGLTIDEMTRQAEELRKRDLFRINHLGVLLERMRSPSLYLEAPLRALAARAANGRTFAELPAPLLISTVDVERGTRVVWGLPGLRDVPVADAVYASCALPGFFPPGRVDGRLCIDGGTVDNLPAAVAALGMDAVIAVDVGSAELGRAADILSQGFASIYMRAATTIMHALQEAPLTSGADRQCCSSGRGSAIDTGSASRTPPKSSKRATRRRSPRSTSWAMRCAPEAFIHAKWSACRWTVTAAPDADSAWRWRRR